MLLLLLEMHPLAAPEAAAPTCVWLLLPPRHTVCTRGCWSFPTCIGRLLLLLAEVLFFLFWLPLLAAGAGGCRALQGTVPAALPT